MEHLSLGDDLRRDRLKHRQPAFQPPHLPTPEPSRSSLEANESNYRDELMQQDVVKDGPSHLYPNGSEAHYAPRNQTAPRSPPYEVVDESKPLLPPLKTVLGQSMSSPPRTPRIRSAHPQPAPREPIYTADTYKPPSLYPNKKQKTTVLEPVPPFVPFSFAPRRPTFDSPIRTELPVNVSYSAPHTQHNPSISRRQSNHRPEPLYPTRSPLNSVNFTPRTSHDTTPTSAPLPQSTQQYAVPEPVPHSASSIQPRSSGLHEKRPRSPSDRRFSSSAFDGYHRYSQEEQRSRSEAHFISSQYRSPTTEHHPQPDGAEQFRRVEQESFRHAQELSRSPFQGGRSLDNFAPGPYEYYYTKSRKRSNLPKHSTEIMRAWFDQNITNPYPSEDQKAAFANATGISLTQVSNWFINHRRRCPELRDKRVERRKP